MQCFCTIFPPQYESTAKRYRNRVFWINTEALKNTTRDRAYISVNLDSLFKNCYCAKNKSDLATLPYILLTFLRIAVSRTYPGVCFSHNTTFQKQVNLQVFLLGIMRIQMKAGVKNQ